MWRNLSDSESALLAVASVLDLIIVSEFIWPSWLYLLVHCVSILAIMDPSSRRGFIFHRGFTYSAIEACLLSNPDTFATPVAISLIHGTCSDIEPLPLPPKATQAGLLHNPLPIPNPTNDLHNKLNLTTSAINRAPVKS
jgi:hypothetical protein